MSGNEPQRRASPVWLVPFALDEHRYALFTHVFLAELLPPTWHIKIKNGKTLTTPDESSLRASWDAWLDPHKSRPIP